MFLLISRKQTPEIEIKIRSLVHAGIDAYAVIDDGPVSGKRFITYPDEIMKSNRWTHHMSQKKNMITAWDKATLFAYSTLNVDYVWFCEDDVYWNTSRIIKHLYENKSDADLIAYPLAQSYNENPEWYHWDKVAMITPNKKHWMATYNQLCRLSRRVLSKMYDLTIQRNRLFFHEGMFATICRINGFKIQYLSEIASSDIYINIRWDKPYTNEQIKELLKEHKYVLLHPVKLN
jgi:hypothetical protein